MKSEFPQADIVGADIEISMKTLCVLFAGNCTGYAFQPLGGGKSAFVRAIANAAKMPDVAEIALFSSGNLPELPSVSVHCSVYSEVAWSASAFFSRMANISEGFDHVFVAWADTPFVDTDFTATLYAKHCKYAAEYTFADGYPYGLAPEILARGLVPILAKLASENQETVARNVIFETVKKDINSFDIETDIAPVDLRQLRLTLACDTRRNTQLCTSLIGITVQNYAEIITAHAKDLRTLPAFYAVQVSGRCPFECIYCPYPEYCRSGTGRSPGKPVTEYEEFMSVADFTQLIEKIAVFSDDAVIGLSLWGECAFHPDIATLVQIVLSHPGLSVLIETTGIGWTEEAITQIAATVAAAKPRVNGQNPVNWIISIDAVGSGMYGAMHKIRNDETPSGAATVLRNVLSFTERLVCRFPHAVWPQMIRMKDNEIELESFYRFWKQKYGQVIIQKHDHFCKTITERRVADLSPLVRNPCWHLKRDLCILMDGTVPFCREDVFASHMCGNAFTDELADIWAKNGALYEQHLCGNYEGMCGACDEYYTFNF